MKRGIIALPAKIAMEPNGFSITVMNSQQDIRYYALYWDKVVFPDNNLVHVDLPDEDVLIQSGVIERPKVHFSGQFKGNEVGRAILAAQAQVAEKLVTENKEIDWTIHQIGEEVHLLRKHLKKRHVLRCDLIGALPVPGADVHIADVLDFKQRRSSELAALHAHLEELYVDIARSPDSEIATRVALRNLGDSIENLNRVSGERWGKTSKYDVGAELNLDGGRLVQAAAAGAALDFFSSGYSLPLATVVAAAASVIRVKAGYSASFSAAANKKHLAYLAKASQEGIL